MAIGTENPLKKVAVDRVFQKSFPDFDISVISSKINTDIPAQPMGMDEIFNGAKQRAEKIKLWITQREKTGLLSAHSHKFFVGIEAGLINYPELPQKYLAHSFCVILNDEGQMGVGISPGWAYPPKIIEKLTANRNLELADVMAQISGDEKIREKKGAVGYFSQGLVSRMDLAQWGVQMALIPFLAKDAYGFDQ